MNKGHGLLIEDYVVAYVGVVPDANSAKLADIDTEAVVISYRVNGVARTAVIKWKDADEGEHIEVTELAHVKGKLVLMAKYAAHKRGYSHQRVTTAVGPNQPDQMLMYVVFALTVWNKLDAKLFHRYLDPIAGEIINKLPALLMPAVGWLKEHGYKIIPAMYAIHILEVIFVMLPMCKKYRVPLWPKIQWAVMNFIEGFPLWKRFKSQIQ